jgi:hypothetical protein
MKRREFLSGGIAAAGGLIAMPTLSAAVGATRPSNPFSVNVISLDCGAEKPFSVFHITDTHLKAVATAPDWTSPYSNGRMVFPYSEELAAAFRSYGGRDYIAEMTEVAVPSYAGTGRRSAAVCAFHAALEKMHPGTFPVPVLTYGPEAGKRALVVVGHFRRFNPADRAYGLDGADIAKRLSSAGMRTTVVSSARIGDISVDDSGYVVYGGERVVYAVFAHFDAVDAAALRRVLGTRKLQTETFICDSPMVGHARILLPAHDTAQKR